MDLTSYPQITRLIRASWLIAYSHLQWRLHGMPPEGKTVGVVFVADDLAAWLIGLLADAGRKKLTTLVLGSDQERALRQAAAAAIESTAAELDPSGGERAGQLAMVVNKVFREVFR